MTNSNNFKKPALFQDIKFKFEDNIYYLYHQSENKVLLLENSVAIKIIRLINGENNIIDIIFHIESEYPETSRTVIEADLNELLAFLESENFIIFLE